jgi:hypothetical protein
VAEVEAVMSEPGQLAESHLGGGGQEHQGVLTGRELRGDTEDPLVAAARLAEGRHIYACHLILNDQPRLRALVARSQEALKTLPMLDPIPPMWLHITTQGIGFVDEIRPDEAEVNSTVTIGYTNGRATRLYRSGLGSHAWLHLMRDTSASLDV